MSTAATALFQQATQLSEAECEELYEQLGNHLHQVPDSDEALSSDMLATLDRRWEEITSGKVQCRDAFEVLAELRAKYHV